MVFFLKTMENCFNFLVHVTHGILIFVTVAQYLEKFQVFYSASFVVFLFISSLLFILKIFVVPTANATGFFRPH